MKLYDILMLPVRMLGVAIAYIGTAVSCIGVYIINFSWKDVEEQWQYSVHGCPECGAPHSYSPEDEIVLRIKEPD
jgi:hypothetical protein